MTETVGEVRALLVLSIGKREHLEVTLPGIQQYAERCGASLIVERELSLPWLIRMRLALVKARRKNLAAYVQKVISLDRALKNFNRVLLLDDSCLINPDAPDLFAIVPKDSIALYAESEHQEYAAPDVDRRFIKRKRSVEIDDYFNTGVILACAKNRHLFSWRAVLLNAGLFAGAYADQGYINYMVASCKEKVYKLPESWNFSPIEDYTNKTTTQLKRLPARFLARVCAQNLVHVTGFYQNRRSILAQVAEQWRECTLSIAP